MRMVEVKVTPVKDEEEVFYSTRTDVTDAAGMVKKGEEAEYSTKDNPEPQKILLADNESLVISGTASTEQVYDPAQMATVARKKELKKPKEAEEEDGVESGKKGKEETGKTDPKSPYPSQAGTYSSSGAPGSQTQGTSSQGPSGPGGARDSHQVKGEKK